VAEEADKENQDPCQVSGSSYEGVSANSDSSADTPPPPGDMSHLPFTNLALSQFTGVHMMRERHRRLGIRLMPPADLN
jgi:hypothetical protein